LKPLCAFSFVQIIRVSFVQQIDPAEDAMRMEEVDEPFSWAFEQACGLREVNRETEKK
jgi:hypothetical protein